MLIVSILMKSCWLCAVLCLLFIHWILLYYYDCLTNAKILPLFDVLEWCTSKKKSGPKFKIIFFLANFRRIVTLQQIRPWTEVPHVLSQNGVTSFLSWTSFKDSGCGPQKTPLLWSLPLPVIQKDTHETKVALSLTKCVCVDFFFFESPSFQRHHLSVRWLFTV